MIMLVVGCGGGIGVGSMVFFCGDFVVDGFGEGASGGAGTGVGRQ